MRIKSILFILPGRIATNAVAQDASMKAINDAISAAERVCLSGSRVHFEAKADGSLSIIKFGLDGSVTGATTVDYITARGAQFIESPEVKRLIDQDIRRCLENEWLRVKQAYDEANIPGLGKARILKKFREQNHGCSLGTHLRCLTANNSQLGCFCEAD